MKLRQATIADIPGMHAVRLSVRENRLAEPARIGPDDYRCRLDGEGRGWVAEVDGRIVGFAIGDRAGGTVWALFVDPGSERQGIGRALHELMMAWFFDAGLGRVTLTTEPRSRAARFYETAGWRFDGMAGGEARYRFDRERWRP